MSATGKAREIILALVLLPGCGEQPASTPRTLGPAQSGTSIVLPEGAFPELGAFRSSPWWALFGTDGKDVRKLVAELRRIPEEEAKTEALLRDEGVDLPPPQRSEPVAGLVPQMPLKRRAFYSMAPSLVAALEPLWNQEQWSGDEVALAQEVSKVLHGKLGGPEVSFAEGDLAANAASLRRLTAWFRDEVTKVDRYAAMTMTMDDGPFVGTPCDSLPDGRPVICPLRGDLRIEAWTVGPKDEEAAIVAGRRGEETLWCRRVTRGDGAPYLGVKVDPLSADDLGPYGWRIHFFAGGEHAHLYVGPDGRFLFYFVSW